MTRMASEVPSLGRRTAMKFSFSRYLPKGDDREKMAKDKEHGLAIWSVHKDGRGARFVTTGWSPDWR